MPSSEHQWLTLWIARKMAADGLRVVSYDGASPQGGAWNDLPAPSLLGAHRADVLAIDPNEGTVAFGEAKTAAGLHASYTRSQLRTICSVRNRRTRVLCPVYVGVPLSSASQLDALLTGLRLPDVRHIRRLLVPDCFLVSGLS